MARWSKRRSTMTRAPRPARIWGGTNCCVGPAKRGASLWSAIRSTVLCSAARTCLPCWFRAVFLEDLVQNLHKEFCVLVCEDERWTDLDDVVMRAVDAGENPAVA